MSILDKILASKYQEVISAKLRTSQRAMEELARARTGAGRSMIDALRRKEGERIRVVAEIKRASPSAGPIRPDADPVDIARQYQQHGAAAVSVLTDEQYFDGRLDFLTAVSGAVSIPVLRKDFIVDPYQVAEARATGADAVLLIVAALTDARLRELLATARGFGLEVLVEVHNASETERALEAGAELIGVNHRDLHTFSVDLALSKQIKEMLDDQVVVAESGIRQPEDLARVDHFGVDAVLIGESLMRASQPGRALQQLLDSLA